MDIKKKKEGLNSQDLDSPDFLDDLDSKNQKKSSNQANQNNQGADKWEVKKLGEVCDVLDNLRKPITKRDRVEGDFPYYGATGILSYVHNYIFSEKLVLIGEDGAKWASGDNTSFIAEGKFWVNNHAHVIRPNRKIIIDEWIVYFLNFSDLSPFISGMTVPKLNQEKMRSIPIPLPPLPEQQRIVSILDEAFSAIDKAKANAEQNLKNAKELFESYLEKCLHHGLKGQHHGLNGLKDSTEKKSVPSEKSHKISDSDKWEVKKLGEVCELRSGKTIPTNLEKTEGDVLYVKVGDMNLPENDIEITTSSRFVNYTEIKVNQIIPNGAIIFPKRGGAIATNKKRKIVKPTIVDLNTMAIIPVNKIDSDFFFHWFQLIDLNSLSNGTSIPQINNYSFNNVKIAFPPLATQQAIVRQLDALRAETQRLELVYQQKITNLEELKKSILQKAFSGELRSPEGAE